MQEPSDTPGPNDRTVISRLRELAEEEPDKPAFVFLDAKWNRAVFTRKEVWDFSRQYANVLTRNGLRRGDVLCNCLINSPERLLTTFGTIIAGGISLHGKMIQPDGSDLLNNLKVSRCTTILLDPGEKVGPYTTLKNIEYLDKESGQPRYRDLPYLTNVIYISVYGNTNYIDVTKEPSQSAPPLLRSLPSEETFYVNENITRDDSVFLFVTSGTTGLPKMVPHTHKSVLAVNWTINGNIVNEKSVYYNDRSLGWMAGAPITYLLIGFTRVLSDLRFEMPEDEITRILEILEKENCNGAMLTPKIIKELTKMMDTLPELRFRLRAICLTGAPVILRDLEALGRITDALGVYCGATETNYSAGIAFPCQKGIKKLSIGKPFPGVEIRIVDNQLQDVPDGVVGDILIRSDGISKGYYQQPEKEKGVFLLDGWIRVGDVGLYDNEGDITLVNRKVDGILTAAGIVYPGLLEAELAIFPGVMGASLIGIPQETAANISGSVHEEVCACIHLLPESNVKEEELRRLCQDFRQSPKMIVPVPDHFLFFEEFPYLTNGKLSRVILKKQALIKLNRI